MNVFRLHIRPKGGLANPVFSFAYCIKAQVLGVGWQTYSDKVVATWEEYEKEASQHHRDLSRVRFLKDHVKADDLIWTRGPWGDYYLAKVDSGWEYFTNEEATDADIVNIVRCRILKVPAIDDVPGKVVACFRPMRAIQRISDDNMTRYSQNLWNRLSKTRYYAVSESTSANVFSFLTADATEDVIFIYLQTKGWLVVPHSRKVDTMSFEFYLIHRDTKRRAVVQIKTGNTKLCTDDWSTQAEHVFLFQANGLYSGGEHASVECLEPKDIEAFMTENRELLPANIVFWLDQTSAKDREVRT